MKRTLRHILGASLLASLLFPIEGQAIPATPHPLVVTLPDGSHLTIRLMGDETHHYYMTTDGCLLTRTTDGFFYYTEVNADLQPVASGIKAHNEEQRGAAERQWVAAMDRDGIVEALQKQQKARPARIVTQRKAQASSYPTQGKQHGLVVLVEFQDTRFSIEQPKAAFDSLLNEPDYARNNATGSVADYFKASSCGQFEPTFDVYGPIRLSHNVSYYGENDATGNDTQPEEMAIEACRMLNDSIDFSTYDNDNDGDIDNVYIYYAGRGEATGGDAATVWPHSWNVFSGSGKTFMFDGVRLNHYACSNELEPGDVMTSIGTFCHEFSHVLGLPDLYSTVYNLAFTPGAWSVMDFGPYNNGSKTPPYYSAYERYELGWLTPIELTGAATLQLSDISHNTAYKIDTDVENEYYLIENRQQTGWDTYLPGHGMLVWHIDYNDDIWVANIVNNYTAHQYIDLIEADADPDDNTRAGDAFPGTAGITALTDSTTPSMRAWSGAALGKPITGITETDGMIALDVCGGHPELPIVTALAATDIRTASFTAHWEANADLKAYMLDVYTISNAGGSRPVTNFVTGYNLLNVGDTTAYTVAGLTPATEYRYVVRGYNGSYAGAASNEVTVVTADPTFDYLTPEVLPSTDITATGFTAHWKALTDATDYEINLYTKMQDAPTSVRLGFDDGLTALPAGWKTTATSTYGSASYSGDSVPSLRLSTDQVYIESPEYDADLRGFSFWHRGVSSNEANRIVVAVKQGSQWGSLDSIMPTNTAGGLITTWAEGSDRPLPTGVRAIRISYDMPAKGGIALDDICIDYGGAIHDVVIEGMTEKSIGDASQVTLTELSSGCTYYYKVRGHNGETYSRWSAEVATATLSANTAIGSVSSGSPTSVRIDMEGDRLTLCPTTTAPRPVCICDLQGTTLHRAILTGTPQTFFLPQHGVYVVRIGAESYKVVR